PRGARSRAGSGGPSRAAPLVLGRELAAPQPGLRDAGGPRQQPERRHGVGPAAAAAGGQGLFAQPDWGRGGPLPGGVGRGPAADRPAGRPLLQKRPAVLGYAAARRGAAGHALGQFLRRIFGAGGLVGGGHGAGLPHLSGGGGRVRARPAAGAQRGHFPALARRGLRRGGPAHGRAGRCLWAFGGAGSHRGAHGAFGAGHCPPHVLPAGGGCTATPGGELRAAGGGPRPAGAAGGLRGALQRPGRRGSPPRPPPGALPFARDRYYPHHRRGAQSGPGDQQPAAGPDPHIHRGRHGADLRAQRQPQEHLVSLARHAAAQPVRRARYALVPLAHHAQRAAGPVRGHRGVPAYPPGYARPRGAALGLDPRASLGNPALAQARNRLVRHRARLGAELRRGAAPGLPRHQAAAGVEADARHGPGRRVLPARPHQRPAQPAAARGPAGPDGAPARHQRLGGLVLLGAVWGWQNARGGRRRHRRAARGTRRNGALRAAQHHYDEPPHAPARALLPGHQRAGRLLAPQEHAQRGPHGFGDAGVRRQRVQGLVFSLPPALPPRFGHGPYHSLRGRFGAHRQPGAARALYRGRPQALSLRRGHGAEPGHLPAGRLPGRVRGPRLPRQQPLPQPRPAKARREWPAPQFQRLSPGGVRGRALLPAPAGVVRPAPGQRRQAAPATRARRPTHYPA
nr:hypothetical protein [Tanacetum cinerariifolium]